MENVAFTKSYLDSLCKMSFTMRGRADLAMMQFMEDKNQKGLNFEKLSGCRENNIFSIRIAGGFRTILGRIPELDAYVFLYADQHDSAYAWAQKVVISLNSETKTVQMYSALEEPAPAPAERGLFPTGQRSDKEFLRLGVPKELMPLVRSIQDEDQFLDEMDAFPDEVRERLFKLATGTPYSDVLADMEANAAAAGDDPMENPDTLRSFSVLPGNSALREAILQGSLEQWRLFLHPDQRKLVEARFKGPALVLGGAGTGKTITALHRAKALAARMIAEKKQGRILYTFYTVNLAGDISEKLRSICTTEEFQRIDVINVDKLVRLNTVSGYEGANILYDKKPLRQLWERAISVGDPQRLRPADFYQREWSAVIAEREAFTLEAYLAAKRTGGGKPLSQKQRREVWPVFEAYQALMEEKRQFDYKTAAYRYRRAVEERAVPQYHHIIVDEAQDLITGSLRLLRALAGPEREDDIFLVGDTRQQIYDRRVSLSDCGIRVQGRILRLHVNYRTTYQLQSSAIRMLEGETFDDLNGGEDPQQRYTPCTLGPPPYVNILDNSEEELQWIISEARRLIDCGVPAKNICLTVPTIQQVGQYIKRLGSRGFRTYELKNKADDQGLEGIRIGTMYRVKGLEFQYMFIAGINQGEFPPASIGQSKDALKRAKCLLYVALTRAQKGAYVSGCGKPTSSFLLQLKRVAEQVAKE